MFCAKCGNQIRDNAKFCNKCGQTTGAMHSIQTTNPSSTNMYCGTCGSKLSSVERFCGSCGAPVERQSGLVPDNSVLKAYKTPISYTSSAYLARGSVVTTTKKISHKKIVLIACAVVAALVIITAIAINSVRNNPERIVIKYIDATYKGDFRTISKYSAIDVDFFAKAISTIEGLTENEYMDELYNAYGARNKQEFYKKKAEEKIQYLEKQYGRNPRFSFDVIDSSLIQGSDRVYILEDIEDLFSWYDLYISDYIQLDQFGEMLELDIEMTISGQYDKETDYFSIVMVKIDGNWRVLDMDDIWYWVVS